MLLWLIETDFFQVPQLHKQVNVNGQARTIQKHATILKNIIVRIARLNDLNELKKLFVKTVTIVCSADYDKQQINAWISGVGA